MMMRTAYTRYLFLVLFPLRVLAGGGEYAVSNIPKELLINAHVVKRAEQIRFEIVNTGTAILRKKYAITILDERGERHAGFHEYYDKLHEIRNIEGTLYDAGGRELKKLKNKQIMDMSGLDDNNLADDSRRKFHHFFHRMYPYTVQYEVEIKYNGTLFFPVWLPREDEYFSVQQSSITITTPDTYTVRHRSFNYTGDPFMENGKNTRSLTWELNNQPAIVDEFASPDWYELNTVVFFGPTEFEIEKYRGNMNSWQDFGRFVHALKQGRDVLPDPVKKKVHELVDGVSDPREKISRLYEYLQKNTRYISIQLGIGGWQPYDAAYVAGKAYGDCKALTNYMYSLLKEAGIPSGYTLVRAGRKAKKVLHDFPSQQFNHVILCVPLPGDTVWLECTSQTLPAGYLSDFTADRYALMIDEKGGTLVRTPKYGINENLEIRNLDAVLDEQATLRLKAKSSYGGLQQDYYHGMINNLSKEKVKEILQDHLDFATYDILHFEYRETKATLPAIEEDLDISVSNYATITGKRLFIVPNIMTRYNRKLTMDSTRKFDIVFDTEYRDIDTVRIQLPQGYAPESMPKDVSLVSRFGQYLCTVKFEGNQLVYYRLMEHNSGRFPAADYGDLVKFYETIYKADRNRVVLVKNETEKKGF